MTTLWQLDGVDVVYRSWWRAPHRALSGATLSVGVGERLGIVGPSGGGKSSLVRAGLGLLRPAAGTVRWLGEDCASWDRRAWQQLRRQVQWLPQRSEAMLHPRVPVREQLAHTARHHGRSPSDVDAFLANLGLAHRADALPHQLSGGERRRAALARVLLPRPRVLIADEPTSGLDAERRHDVLQHVLAVPEGGARVVVGHDLPALVASCDRLVVVVDGRIVADLPTSPLRQGTYLAEDPAFASLLDASGYQPQRLPS